MSHPTPTKRLAKAFHYTSPGTHHVPAPTAGDRIATKYNDFTLGLHLHPTQLDSPAHQRHDGHVFRLLNVRISTTEVDLFDVLCLTCFNNPNHRGPTVLCGLPYDTITARHAEMPAEGEMDLRDEIASVARQSGWERMQCTDIDVYFQRQLLSQRPVVIEWWDEHNARAVWLDGKRGDGPDDVTPTHGLVYSMCFVFDLDLAREGGAK